jgi:hypothetical protein
VVAVGFNADVTHAERQSRARHAYIGTGILAVVPSAPTTQPAVTDGDD